MVCLVVDLDTRIHWRDNLSIERKRLHCGVVYLFVVIVVVVCTRGMA